MSTPPEQPPDEHGAGPSPLGPPEAGGPVEPAEHPVVLLVEQALSALDAQQIRGLHVDMPATVSYSVLVPVEDAAGRVEAAMGTLGSGEMLAPMMDRSDYAELQQELVEAARRSAAGCISALETEGGHAEAQVIAGDPVQALIEKVEQVGAREAIVLTRPHIVAEFFHVDWTSRARRKLGVPVLHLLEHENFDEQAGQGEGISGF